MGEPAKQMDSNNIDVNFIKPFVDGAKTTLDVQCSTQCTPGKPFFKDPAKKLDIDIAAVIGITSDSFNGSVTICFSKNMFLGVMGRMLDEKYEEITPDLEDGAAELLNIIFGWAKRVLNDQGYTLQKAIPTIVKGADLEVQYLTPRKTIVLPFETDLGGFHIEVTADPTEKK